MKTFLIYEETTTEVTAYDATDAEAYYLDVVAQQNDPEKRIKGFEVHERTVEEVIPGVTRVKL